MRHIPVFTFINKMDREARDIFDLLDEIEKELWNPNLSGKLANPVPVNSLQAFTTEKARKSIYLKTQ